MLFGGPMPGVMAPMPATAPNAGAAASGPLAAVDRVRNVFPETWLWTNSTSGYSMQSTNLCLSQKPLYNQRKPKQNISQYHACTCSVYCQILKLLCVRFEIFNEIRQHFRIYGNTSRIKMNADHRNYVCGFFYSLRNGDNLQYFKFIIHMFLHRKFIPFQTRLISYKWQIPKTSVYFLFQSYKELFLSVEFTLRVYLA